MFEVEITDAKQHISEKNPTGRAASDPTWAVFAITVTAGSREKTLYQLVPTEKETFGEGKYKYIQYRKLKEFCAALGETLNTETAGIVLSRLFGNPDNLKGRKLHILFGYKGLHAIKNESGTYDLVNKDGTPSDLGGGFADYAAVKLALLDAQTETGKTFKLSDLEVIKFSKA